MLCVCVFVCLFLVYAVDFMVQLNERQWEKEIEMLEKNTHTMFLSRFSFTLVLREVTVARCFLFCCGWYCSFPSFLSKSAFFLTEFGLFWWWKKVEQVATVEQLVVCVVCEYCWEVATKKGCNEEKLPVESMRSRLVRGLYHAQG